MAGFDLEKAQKAMGNLYIAQEPDPDCTMCDGKGIRTMTLCVGMNRYPSETYCDCTVKGFVPRKKK